MLPKPKNQWLMVVGVRKSDSTMNFSIRNRFVQTITVFFEIFESIFEISAFWPYNTHSDLSAREQSEMCLLSQMRRMMTVLVPPLNARISTPVWHSLCIGSHFSESNEHFTTRFWKCHYIATEDHFCTRKDKSGSEIDKSVSNRSKTARNGI